MTPTEAAARDDGIWALLPVFANIAPICLASLLYVLVVGRWGCCCLYVCVRVWGEPPGGCPSSPAGAKGRLGTQPKSHLNVWHNVCERGCCTTSAGEVAAQRRERGCCTTSAREVAARLRERGCCTTSARGVAAQRPRNRLLRNVCERGCFTTSAREVAAQHRERGCGTTSAKEVASQVLERGCCLRPRERLLHNARERGCSTTSAREVAAQRPRERSQHNRSERGC